MNSSITEISQEIERGGDLPGFTFDACLQNLTVNDKLREVFEMSPDEPITMSIGDWKERFYREEFRSENWVESGNLLVRESKAILIRTFPILPSGKSEFLTLCWPVFEGSEVARYDAYVVPASDPEMRLSIWLSYRIAKQRERLRELSFQRNIVSLLTL